MIINGREIAKQVLGDLKLRVEKLKEKGITPKLAVILMGDEKSSLTYIKQKELKAKEISAEIEIHRFDELVTNAEIEILVKKLDIDEKIHGIIIQRPVPEHIEIDKLEDFISPEKEIDGFGSQPIFPVPVAEAVLLLLEDVYLKQNVKNLLSNWIKTKKMAVLGKGETAGQPIASYFEKYGAKLIVIDSKTQNKDSLTKDADIVVSAVGKTVINTSSIKKGVILIGVGMHTENGKLCGDYNEEEIEKTASFYTPTPGGVGPVNVAMLLKNLVEAAEETLPI